MARTQPSLAFPAFDAAWKVAKLEDAKRAQVPYAPVPAGRPVCAVKVDDAWVRHEDGPWVVAYRLVLQTGRLVIGELRVYPRVPLDPDGVVAGVLPPWNVVRDLQGMHGAAPRGGLTSSIVHRLTPARDVNNVGRLILNGLRSSSASGVQEAIWQHLRALGVHTDTAPPPATAHGSGGPRGKALAFYRRAARVYLDAPSRPVQAVAKALQLSPANARDVIYRARHRYGLLPSTTRGKAGAPDLATLRQMAGAARRRA